MNAHSPFRLPPQPVQPPAEIQAAVEESVARFKTYLVNGLAPLGPAAKLPQIANRVEQWVADYRGEAAQLAKAAFDAGVEAGRRGK